MMMGRFHVWEPDAGQVERDGARISAHSAGDAVEEWAVNDDHTSADDAIKQARHRWNSRMVRQQPNVCIEPPRAATE